MIAENVRFPVRFWVSDAQQMLFFSFVRWVDDVLAIKDKLSSDVIDGRFPDDTTTREIPDTFQKYNNQFFQDLDGLIDNYRNK